MHDLIRFIISAMIVVVSGCSIPLPGGEPAPSSPLPRGVFSTTDECDLEITSPTGEQTTQPQTMEISFRINDRGVPIVLGFEMAIGRVVPIGAARETYTSIEATDNGLIIHTAISGSVNNVSTSGLSISTLSTTDTGEIEYNFSQTSSDGNGFQFSMDCTFLLAP